VTALSLSLLAAHATEARAQAAPPRAQKPAPKLTKPPKLIQFVDAPFPESEKKTGQGASVVLEIIISATGTVEAARVIGSAGPAFDAAALEAVQAFRFEPAEIDDKPAQIKIQYKYDFVLEDAPPPETAFSGEVRKRGTGEPLAGVTVRLDSGQEAVTDAQGKFEIRNVAPGKHTVTLSGASLSPLQTEESLGAGESIAVRYDVDLVAATPEDEKEDPDDMEILVVAPKLTRQVVATRVDAESARRVAGTQGDVLKIVENMPGVARAAVGSGDVVVWGAAPQDTRVYVDGVRVPALYHFGGLRSVVHSDLVQSVELVPGAYGSAYGRGLGGLVIVDTRDPDDARLRGSLQLDLLDASGAVHGKLAEDVQLSAAVRRSHLREVLSGTVEEDIEEFFPVPRYHDASARVRYEPSNAEWVELGGMLSGDSVTRTIGSADPLSRRSETRDIGFDRLFVRYRREPGDGTRVSLVPWIGRDRNRLTGEFGAVPVELRVDSVLFGLRTSWTGPLAEHVTGTAGLDVEVIQSTLRREGSLSSPPREGDARVFGQPPADQVNADDWKATTGSAAPFLEADIGLFDDKLHLVPGVRFEPFYSSVNRRRPAEGDVPSVGASAAELSIQPRLSIRYALEPRVGFKAAFGRYRQLPAPEDVSSVFGNPRLGTSQATHFLAGGDFKWSRTLSLETTVFYSKSEDLAARNPSRAPRAGEALQNVGEGRSYGMQFLLRRELADGLFGWLAYTVLRSERRDHPGVDWRLFDFDQTHVVTALASYDLGKGFEVGARFRAATGYPRTPVIDAYHDVRRDQYEPVLGPRNSERIPAFYQIDVRGSKRWKIAGTELEAYLDVQNVTNRENQEEIAYASDYSERRFIRGLPILPVVGARWSF
jgi:TonB family protein